MGQFSSDSIFVESDYRNMGIGDKLMNKALDWLDREGTTTKALMVIYGNERVFRFYRKFGFQPRAVRLIQTEMG